MGFFVDFNIQKARVLKNLGKKRLTKHLMKKNNFPKFVATLIADKIVDERVYLPHKHSKSCYKICI